MKRLRLIGILCLSGLLVCALIYKLAATASVREASRIDVAVVADTSDNKNEVELLQYISDVKSGFEKEYGVSIHVTVIPKKEYSTWLSNSILSGTAPDIFSVLPADFYTYASIGLLEPLDSSFERLSYSSVTSPWKYDQTLYAMPYFTSPPCIIVNEALLVDKYFPIEENSFDWIDIIYASKFFTEDITGDNIPDVFGICDLNWRRLVYANGGMMFDFPNRKANFTQDAVEYAVRFSILISKVTLDSYAGVFEQGNAVMKSTTLRDAISILRNNPQGQYRILPFPAGPDGDFHTEPTDIPLAVNASSETKQMALLFLKSLCIDQDNQTMLSQKTNGYPVAKSAGEATAANIKNYVSERTIEKILNIKTVPIEFNRYYEMMSTIDNDIFQLLKTDSNVDNELRRIEEYVSDALEKIE